MEAATAWAGSLAAQSSLGTPALTHPPLPRPSQPRKVKPAEDPHRLGLLLEWVYGTIVSTAEKARDGAKRSLGGNSCRDFVLTLLIDLALLR